MTKTIPLNEEAIISANALYDVTTAKKCEEALKDLTADINRLKKHSDLALKEGKYEKAKRYDKWRIQASEIFSVVWNMWAEDYNYGAEA